MNRSRMPVLLFMVIGLAILVGLGTWQVQRLFWKEALIERVEERLGSAPQDLLQLSKTGFVKQKHEYLPVSFSGSFDHAGEVYFFTTGPGGSSGWNVHTPVELSTGEFVIVNRGFVPFDLRTPALRAEGQLAGLQEMQGLLRFPLVDKPFGSFDNDFDKREFYWRNVPEMSSVMGSDTRFFLSVIVDLDLSDLPGGWPRGGATIVSFPNNHLQYAITWFGLALTLLGVGGYFLISGRGRNVET